jgi:excisionase family DNA binding protein
MTARAFTVASLANAWECSEGVIRKLIRDGELGCFRLGTLIRIPAEEVARFECQNIQSSGSEVVTPSSIETLEDNDTERGFSQPTVLGLKRRLGAGGRPDTTVHHGPWARS